MKNFLFLLAVLPGSLLAQQLVLPDAPNWNRLDEGKALVFSLKISDNSEVVRYSLDGGTEFGMQMDSLGHFSWTPSYDIADRITREKEVNVIFQADLKGGARLRQPVKFTVVHVNRPPIADELPTFYVKQNAPNQYQIPAVYVHDPDGDPVIFRAHPAEMPEGAVLTSLGNLSWTPSRNQFNALKNNPLNITFSVEDQPDKAETIGHIRIAQTQLDLPPDLLLVPADSVLNIRENDVVSFKVYVADPNGDDNIEQVGFVSSDTKVPQTCMTQNSRVQGEFNWSPGYSFVEEVEKKKEVLLTFFVIDKSANRVQKKVRVVVNDTENVEEKDKQLYQKYFYSMAYTKNLIDLLDENNESLEKVYRKARKGKKNRTVLNASLGAVTGLSPLVLQPDPAKSVTVVGGTSVLTLNSLEAGQVVGKNVNEYQNKIKSNRDLRTQLQLKGNFFARKYSLKSGRRSTEFEYDRDDLSRMMNSDVVSTLEISAASRSLPTAKEIKKTFADFSEEP
ncbi:MAG: hypothetical protein JST46_01385 [Bacteroidetes bacterium]|nr:hypothetical protein [Bacteroidota bacterium]